MSRGGGRWAPIYPKIDPCASMPGTNAYNNRRPNTAPPSAVRFSAPEPKHIEFDAQKGDVVVLHSPHERCGIREYGRQLDEALGKHVRVHACSIQDVVTLREPTGVSVLVHWEPGLAPWDLGERLQALRAQGARVVLCCHRFVGSEPAADAVVVHRAMGGQTVEIPLACPSYEPPMGRLELREALGYPLGSVVLMTLGFLAQWKRIPETLAALLPHVQPSWIVHVQTPWPYTGGDAAQAEENEVRNVIARFHGCDVRFSTEFLSERNLLDRVHAADLGFLFHGQHTQSASAAAKQFLSARTPLVVTGSSHTSDLAGGIVRVPELDPHALANAVTRVAQDENERLRLRKDAQVEYDRINMGVVAAKYVELFRGLT